MTYEKLPDGTPSWEKDPEANKDYELLWSNWLAGDTIVTSVWEAPTGITLASPTQTTVSTKVWISGGVLGKRYRVQNKITTTGGRTEVQSIEILIKAK